MLHINNNSFYLPSVGRAPKKTTFFTISIEAQYSYHYKIGYIENSWKMFFWKFMLARCYGNRRHLGFQDTFLKPKGFLIYWSILFKLWEMVAKCIVFQTLWQNFEILLRIEVIAILILWPIIPLEIGTKRGITLFLIDFSKFCHNVL